MNHQEEFPLVTVGALIFNHLGECLLVKTHKWKNLYGVPGGKIKKGETCQEALERELLEETGLKIRNAEFILLQDSVFSPEFYKPAHFVLLNYSCKTDDSLVVLNEEAESFVWLKPEKALELKLNEPTRKLIECFLENDKNV